MHDIFYNIDHKPIEILKDCYDKKFNWWTDKLDGLQRKRINMTFEEIMEKINKDTYFVFIHRYNVMFNPECAEKNKDGKLVNLFGMPEEYIEAGFRANGYFLWINVYIEYLDYFIDKYDLSERKL